MDESLRKAQRRWERDRDDDSAHAYLVAMLRADSLVLQLMRRLCQVSLELSNEPSWDRVVRWWLQGERVTVDPPTGRETAAERVREILTLRPPGHAEAPPPIDGANRGAAWPWLCAGCVCGHFRGNHVEAGGTRRGCLVCGDLCRGFEPMRTEETCVERSCERPAFEGYLTCLRHVQSRIPSRPVMF